MCQEFLMHTSKFTLTELENARSVLEEIPDSEDDNVTITREEFDSSVDTMKKAKTPGPDEIPSEVCQSSTVTREVLYDVFLQKVWNMHKETVCIPVN